MAALYASLQSWICMYHGQDLSRCKHTKVCEMHFPWNVLGSGALVRVAAPTRRGAARRQAGHEWLRDSLPLCSLALHG